MSEPSQPVFFSDLDGTLLDHDTYAWHEARSAVEALERFAIPLVLVSSKTRAEIRPLRAELGNQHPYIVENGAATYVPASYFAELDDSAADGEERSIGTGPTRAAIGEVLSRLQEANGYRFTSFTELGTDGIAAVTGLPPARAAAANERAASEPLLWQDDEDRVPELASHLAPAGLRCVRGGRFLHVMGKFDKADAVANLVRRYQHQYAPASVMSVALGDGPNDLAMLAGADIAVVVKGKHAHAMPLTTPSRIIRTELQGPAGWREAVLEILSDFIEAP